ncbi:cobalamin biosynthesis protein CobD [Aliishimia ponticola]|uniref:Cobalamin biosynthesis protein CobD n=1 Tax=Aliishimia ponticola TaxID=2499833 RepID=A0A4S4NF46_9RHOB|nr:adenosylcobinamide-phosphate synthase CbiB [Aliishimia ponticola]THH38182.1 cobalamin biosynthesis protein CobD [Aliishimia ponticola]
MSFAAMMIVACALDAVLGWPGRLYARIGHPVTWIGALISGLERRLNSGAASRRIGAGAVTTVAVVGVTAALALAVQALLPDGAVGVVLGGVLAWPFVALRSMHDHVKAVATPLAAGDLQGARHAVSMIVGRDPTKLDAAGVARGAMESLAENTSDGIVAPVFWGAVAGLPGLAAYKAINTLDSMIGHRNARYDAFGKVAARLDDLVNLIPARLTGALFVLVSGRARDAARVMWRDAGHHRSPNAGWPEGAMAGALQVRLSGPRVYGDRIAEEPWVNAGAPDPSAMDLARGLRLYRRAMLAMVALLALAGLAGL